MRIAVFQYRLASVMVETVILVLRLARHQAFEGGVAEVEGLEVGKRVISDQGGVVEAYQLFACRLTTALLVTSGAPHQVVRSKDC